MRFSSRLMLAISIAVLGSFSQLASATVLNQSYSGSFPASISGTLPDQGSVLEESITLNTTSDVTAYTTSYANGGFEPNILLFDPSGVAIAASGPQGSGPTVTSTSDLDAYLSDAGLAAGTYTLALMDWQVGQSLTATNLSDGFTFNSGDGMNFVDANGGTRTGAYTLDITVTPSAGGAAAPEPATLWLALPALALFGLCMRKRRLDWK